MKIEPLKIVIERFAFKQDYTIGNIFINGTQICNSLEDTVRELGKHGEGKILEKTAIPAGKYKMMLTFWPKYQIWTPSLFNVPFFEGIRIHSGNNAEQTHGCILTGRNTVVGKLTESWSCFSELMTFLEKGKWYEIEIIDKK
jgi:hypothetical protein